MNPTLCPNGPIPIAFPYNDAYIQFIIDEACGPLPSQAPSTSPSAVASPSPSVSVVPSISLAPTVSPSISFAPSLSLVPSFSPTVTSCNPSSIQIQNLTTSRKITFTFPSMAPASSIVQLRTFIRGDYKHSSEFADFYWLNNGTPQNLIGRNNGGEDCSEGFLEQDFIIAPDTYNAWVQSNTTIQILLVASSAVGPSLCPDNYRGLGSPFSFNDAFVQFNIDEACGLVDSQGLSTDRNSNDGGGEGADDRDQFLRKSRRRRN